MNDTSVHSAVRPPQQDRSRQNWERVLSAGLDLFAERGWDGFTIGEVCRRARVSAPSIYARVDGKAGLFRAVHARWLEQATESEDELEARMLGRGGSVGENAEAAAEVIVSLFTEHEAILRAVSDRAPHDPELLAVGAASSQRMIDRLTPHIDLPSVEAADILRTVYAECVLRLRYGPAFLTPETEDDAAFLARMRRTARRLAASASSAAD